MTDTTTTDLIAPDVETRLTNPEALAKLVAALKAARFEGDLDDVVLISVAQTLEVTDETSATQGFGLLADLTALAERITAHHDRFRKPLNILTATVREMEHHVIDEVLETKKRLSRVLGAWKIAAEQRARAEAAARQQAADLAAQAAQAAKAATLDRLADTTPDPAFQAVLREEAAAVAEQTIKAAPVAAVPVKTPKGAHVRTTWSAEVTDVKALVRAWLDGRCHLPEEQIVAGLQSFLDKQAAALGGALPQAYPGTVAVPDHSGVVRRTHRSGS